VDERRTHDLLDNSVKSNDGGIVTPSSLAVLMPIGGHFVMDPQDAWKFRGQMS
jgi:hypothetical protein